MAGNSSDPLSGLFGAYYPYHFSHTSEAGHGLNSHQEYLVAPWGLLLLTASSVGLLYYLNHLASYKDGLPLVNRRFALEPSIFSRFRWAFNSIDILAAAQEKYQGAPYRLARGDTDVIVVPSQLIPELNKLPQSLMSSRKSHASSLAGYLNGMDIVETTNQHVKMLLNRVTPALTKLLKPASQRIEKDIMQLFPTDEEVWTAVEPLDKIVHCVSHAITLTTFGLPICDNQDLIRLCYEHTHNVFAIMFVMRLFPRTIQPLLVWLLPVRWKLIQTWKTLENFIIPVVQQRRDEPLKTEAPDLISCMLAEAKTEEEKDPKLLTRLVGSVIAGGTYSSAAFMFSVIVDLVSRPDFLEEIRQEIRETHQRVNGKWDLAAFNSLDKLESAMKESSRLAPGALLVYSRLMEGDCVLSNGLRLPKGQHITTAGYTRSLDPSIYSNPKEYDAMRSYKQDLQAHRAQPFRSLEGEDRRWGAGRWACPGRFIASLVSKIILVRMFDEFDFAYVGGQRPPTSIMHEFVFFHPSTKLLMRRRRESVGIRY